MVIKKEMQWFLGLIIGLVLFLYFLGPILPPFLIGFIIAYLGNPLVNLLQRAKISRTVSAVFVFLFLFGLIVGIFLLVIPILQEELVELFNTIPGFVTWAQQSLVPWLNGQFGLQESLNPETIKKVITGNLPQTGNVLITVWKTLSVSGIALLNTIISILLVLVVTFYLLRDWDLVWKNMQTLIPKSLRSQVIHFVKECNEVMGGFFRGQVLVILALSVIYAVGLWIAGLSTALIIGVLSGIINIVPYLGMIIGLIVASIAMLVQYHDWMHVIYALIVFGVGKLMDDMVLTPNLVGDRIGLHPVVVIFAILAGGHLFGLLGILLALPVASLILVLIRHLRYYFTHSRA